MFNIGDWVRLNFSMDKEFAKVAASMGTSYLVDDEESFLMIVYNPHNGFFAVPGLTRHNIQRIEDSEVPDNIKEEYFLWSLEN